VGRAALGKTIHLWRRQRRRQKRTKPGAKGVLDRSRGAGIRKRFGAAARGRAIPRFQHRAPRPEVTQMKTPTRRIRFYGVKTFERIPHLQKLPAEERFAMRVVGHVLPFRTNSYLVEELIDWDNVPDDPIFQLTFPQRDMLHPDQFLRMASVIRDGGTKEEIAEMASEIRLELNPHPAGQMSANVPYLGDERIQGVQHKYRETCLIFPSAGQTCHAYCTFCFRWPQFVGMRGLKFATDESRRFQAYLRTHREITDVLVTGGDPMVMSAKNLAGYIEPLLGPSPIRTPRTCSGSSSGSCGRASTSP
jgi:L-lysine 2,3-aminomutase